MEAKTKDLWVFVETNEDGSAKNVGIELLSPGKMMADKQGGALVAVVIGSGVDAAVQAAAEHGADKVIVVDGPEYKHYSTDAYVIALNAMVEKYGPTSMLIGATNNGRDLGPRLSCRRRLSRVNAQKSKNIFYEARMRAISSRKSCSEHR